MNILLQLAFPWLRGWTTCHDFLGSRQSTYKPRQPFTRAVQILIRIAIRVQPTSGGGLCNPDCNRDHLSLHSSMKLRHKTPHGSSPVPTISHELLFDRLCASFRSKPRPK